MPPRWLLLGAALVLACWQPLLVPKQQELLRGSRRTIEQQRGLQHPDRPLQLPDSHHALWRLGHCAAQLKNSGSVDVQGTLQEAATILRIANVSISTVLSTEDLLKHQAARSARISTA